MNTLLFFKQAAVQHGNSNIVSCFQRDTEVNGLYMLLVIGPVAVNSSLQATTLYCHFAA